MQKGRHITEMGSLRQRKSACRITPHACIGVFLLPILEFARPAANNPVDLTARFSRRSGAGRVDVPTQPFRPFWLLFWPQNLTGQLCAPPRQLPAFGSLSPAFQLSLCRSGKDAVRGENLHIDQSSGLAAAQSLCICARAPQEWAKARQSRGYRGRSVAHAARLRGTYLDDMRWTGKLALNQAERSKGAFRCVNHSLRPCSQAPQPLRLAAIPPGSRCSMVPVQGRQGPRCSTAASSPAQPSALLATSSTARKIRAAAKPASGARAIRGLLTSRFDAGAPPPRDIPVCGGFLCARQTHQHGPQGTAHV